MGYSLKFIISIAERKFGKKDKKAIEKYIKEFDPSKSQFAEDIREYNLIVDAERAKEEENAFRFRILQDVRYLRIVYGKSGETVGKADKTSVTKSLDIYGIRTTFTTDPVEYDPEKKYLLHSYEIQKKNGFHHKTENVVAVLKDICSRKDANEHYKSYYSALFTATYCMAMENKPDVMELFTDFDNFMTELLKTEIVPLAENKIDVNKAVHGGLEETERIAFLNKHHSLSDQVEVIDRVEIEPEKDNVKTK